MSSHGVWDSVQIAGCNLIISTLITGRQLNRYCTSPCTDMKGGNFYPGTGAADESSSNWKPSLAASEFSPDLVIVSAGFDAAIGDPLGCCDVAPAGYSRMTHMLGDQVKRKLVQVPTWWKWARKKLLYNFFLSALMSSKIDYMLLTQIF
ncbi:hypothetical protein Bca4012_068555 [Brassica carinata]|uniref:histone deacetylase n=1 Tax=Brassica carinata TaxID=52824 RepID=A0A8X8AZW7_BRACI|nr:hypothetical protein Bca52824_020772 [Brassica carinata]